MKTSFSALLLISFEISYLRYSFYFHNSASMFYCDYNCFLLLFTDSPLLLAKDDSYWAFSRYSASIAICSRAFYSASLSF